MPGLNRREALDYITSRLSDYPDQRIEALDLGEDLDGLPLALAQATAAMSARRQGCREYRALLAHVEAADWRPVIDSVFGLEQLDLAADRLNRRKSTYIH